MAIKLKNALLYSFIKIWLRLALKFYCRDVRITPTAVKFATPAILAVTHSNSFFDALIVAAYYPEQIYFLARGDAFNKKWAAWILTRLNLLPIYRLEEGKEHLGNNERSFAACMAVFKKGGTILIFPEGLSRHELSLRPLRKGAARLALQAWSESEVNGLVVQPISISYNSFETVPKDVRVQYTMPIDRGRVSEAQEGVFYNQFNMLLKERLEEGIYAPNSVTEAKSTNKNLKKLLLAVPALVGYVSQRWYYLAWKKKVSIKTKDTVFYDSVLFAVLMLTYPLLVCVVTIVAVLVTGNILCWLLLAVLPFTAWCYKEYKGL